MSQAVLGIRGGLRDPDLVSRTGRGSLDLASSRHTLPTVLGLGAAVLTGPKGPLLGVSRRIDLGIDRDGPQAGVFSFPTKD